MVLPIRISLSPGPAAETRPVAIEPAIKAKISAAATLRRPTGRSRRIASLANGNLNSNACQTMSITVRIVAPHASSHLVQVLVHFFVSISPSNVEQSHGTTRQHCVSIGSIVCRREPRHLVQDVACISVRCTPPVLPGRGTRESLTSEVIAGMTETCDHQATDVGQGLLAMHQIVSAPVDS